LIIGFQRLTFIGPWNEFLWPFLITKEQGLQPLAVALANYIDNVAATATNPYGAILAGSCVLAAFDRRSGRRC
jgi:multiple sugar transport system permease protein